MALYANLTVPVEDIIGDDYDPRRTAVWIEANTPHSLIVVDGTSLRIGGRREKIGTDGTVTFTNLVTTNSADNPTEFAYRVSIIYTPVGDRQQRVWTSGEFPFTATVTLSMASTPQAFDDLAIAPTWQSTFRAEMEAIAGLTGEDAAIANRINTPGSDTELALGAYVATGADSRITTATQPNGSVWKVGPTRVNVRNYGVSTANSSATNDTALAAIFAAETSGVMVAFPDLGTYNFSAPLPNRSLMNIEGRGRQTILNWTSGNMLNVTDPTLVQMARFSDLKITNSGTAGHIIQSLGAGGGIIHPSFERCMIQPGVDGTSILKSATDNLFGLTFRDCLLHRNATATVPAFDIVGLTGGGTNNIHISGGEWHSHGCSTTPFFKADANSSSTMLNFTFEKIIGEQNHGGLIHIGGAAGIRVFDVVDQDATMAYADDLFKFTAGTGGVECNNVNIDRAGSYTGFGLAGGKAHLRITGGVGHKVGRIWKDSILPGTVILPTGSRAIVRETPAATNALPLEFISTLPATMTTTQHTVVTTVTGTLTLPASPVTGQEFRVKAVHGSGCTVSGNGANIDGVATKSLVQYEVLNVVWDGSAWRRL